MTVAAIVIAHSADDALAPVEGTPRVRSRVDAAWAGGAIPIIVVCPDPEGAVAASLGDAPATVVSPGPDVPHGSAWFVAGFDAALSAVAETAAAMLFPSRFVWLDPETVTTLIEAHGASPRAVVRPTFRGEPGFPAVVPTAWLETLRAQAGSSGPDALAAVVAAGADEVRLEVGDPGTVLDASTARSELPPYQGPPEPAGGPPPEWNAALADRIGQSPPE